MFRSLYTVDITIDYPGFRRILRRCYQRATSPGITVSIDDYFSQCQFRNMTRTKDIYILNASLTEQRRFIEMIILGVER